MYLARNYIILCMIYYFMVIYMNEGECHSRKTKHSKVLILGAGMSGITAAKTFHDHAIDDFVIVEGYKQIGGRMRTAEFAGNIIELGANWVQGLKNNPIWQMVKEAGLKGGLTMADPTTGYYITRNETGGDVTSSDMHKEFIKIQGKLDDIVKKRRLSNLGDIDVATGLKLAGWQAKNAAQTLVEYFQYDFDSAVSPHYQSCEVKMVENGTIGQESGEQYFITDPRGYSYIVDKMASTFLSPHDTRLQLNQVVNQINWNNKGVSVSTITGEIYTAEYLLITFSIGVLKSNKVQFQPELPATILEPIFKQDMACYIKIFLKFPKRFWDPKQYIFYATDRRGYYPIWQDLGVSGSFPANINVLLVTVTGEEAHRIQYQTDSETKAEIMKILRNVYGQDIPEATDILYKRWGHDPLFYGTYSSIPIGMSHEDYIALSSNTSTMYFAGEATHEWYNGFVHGAYYSGKERALKMIQDMLAVH